PEELRQPLRAAATLDEPLFFASAGDLAARLPELARFRSGEGAVASLPLSVGDARLGTLFLSFPFEGPFTPGDRALLLALGDLSAGVVDRSRLAARERQTRAHLDFLADASRTLAESLDLDVTLRTAAALAIPILADGAILDVVTPDGGFRRVANLPAGTAEEAEAIESDHPLGDAEHPTRRAIRETRTLRYDLAGERATRAASRNGRRRPRPARRHALTAPLVLGTEPFGAITLYRSNAGPYSDDEVAIAEEFARRAARSIENSRLHGDHQRALEQATTLVRLNAAVAEALSPDEVAGLLLDAVMPILGARRGAVLERDETTRELVVVRVRDYAVEPGDRIEFASTPAEAALASGETVTGHESDWSERLPVAGAAPTKGSSLVAPLVVGGEPLGVVTLGFDEDPRTAPSVMSTFRGLIDAGAQAIVRASLLDSQRRQLERESAVARVNEAVADARSPEEVARVLLSGVFERVDAASASVTLLDAAAGEFVLAGILTGDQPEPVTRGRWSADMASPARDVVRSGSPLVIDVAEYRRRYPEIVAISEPTGMTSYAAVPLLAGTRAVGALGLRFAERHELTAADLENLRAMANAGGEAIERARLREAERRALGLLEGVIAALPVGVVIVDAPGGRVLHANPAIADLLGRTPRVAIQLDSASMQLRYPDGRPMPVAESPLAKAAGEGISTGPVEAILVREDGTERRVLLDGLPVRDEAGRLLAAAGTWTDITERRAAEAAREAFLGVLSHELRTPITSILAGSGILARRTLGEEEAELVTDINAESERLHRLVEDLLVLSRVERGADLRRFDPVLVQHVARRVVSHEASRWPDRRFEAMIPPGVPAASGDEAYVEQVIRNLLSNAAKYGPPGGVVELVVSSAESGVVIRVLDRGPGFDERDLGRVFELFYRSPAATKVAPGAGIGLYTSRVLAEAMGGRIWVANREGGGAEVGVELPLAALDQEV
ncbi:MAG TPA: GAF domain-containing protein, partial [Candidatus Limnocylindrales bacterium]|nr:GAF domain-containing protein [Candidatus Limnocylindrales bacterium]